MVMRMRPMHMKTLRLCSQEENSSAVPVRPRLKTEFHLESYPNAGIRRPLTPRVSRERKRVGLTRLLCLSFKQFFNPTQVSAQLSFSLPQTQATNLPFFVKDRKCAGY